MANIIGSTKPGVNLSGPSKPIDLTQAKEITCQNCEGSIFLPANKFLKVPKISAGTPQDLLIPVEVFLCGDCGEICEELLPKELQVKK